jgi:nucleotide-binding universal stress UspA family protein
MKPMFKSIAVALDSSAAASAALAEATRLAALDGAKLVLTNVLEIDKLAAVTGFQTTYQPTVIRTLERDGETLLREAAAAAAHDGVEALTVTAEGDAVDEILRIAEENNCGLIVLGTHGRGGLPRLFLGSVAEGVLRRSKVPVLVTPVH